MNANFKKRLLSYLNNDKAVYGDFKNYSEFVKEVRFLISSFNEAIRDEDIVLINDNDEISLILSDMDILSTIEQLEDEGLINRFDYLHDGYFYAHSIFSDMEAIVNQPVKMAQYAMFN